MHVNDPKVVPLAALGLVAVVALTGTLVVQRLDRIAQAAERSEALLQEQARESVRAPKATTRRTLSRVRRASSLPLPDAEEEGVEVAPEPPSEEGRSYTAIRRIGERSLELGIPLELPRQLNEVVPGRLSRQHDLQDPWDGIGAGVVAPERLRLVSLGKPVSASDDFPIIGELSYVTDGDKEGGEGYYVELLDGIQYVQIDLEAEYDLYLIALWHFYHAEPRVYMDVAILSSTRADFATFDVLFNNDQDDSLGLGDPQDREYVESYRGLLQGVEGKTARYIRCYSNGNTMNSMNHYTEVEVYGLAVE